MVLDVCVPPQSLVTQWGIARKAVLQSPSLAIRVMSKKAFLAFDLKDLVRLSAMPSKMRVA